MRRILAFMLALVMAAIRSGTALAGLSIDPDTLTSREGAGALPALLLVTWDRYLPS